MAHRMTRRLDSIERRIGGQVDQWIRLVDQQPDYEERLEEAYRNGKSIIVRQIVDPKNHVANNEQQQERHNPPSLNPLKMHDF